MQRSRRKHLRTWAGPVDLSTASVSGWDGSGWRRIGGREQLERWERREGRILLRVDGVSGSYVTLSRQSTAARMPGRTEAERTYGRALGHALLRMEVAGAGQRSLRVLGAAAATCGATDVAVEAIGAAAALVGGGANRWAADLAVALRRDPGPLRQLPALVGRTGGARGGVRPASLASALRVTSTLREVHRAARAGGSEAPSSGHTPHLASAPATPGERWDGWELSASPREGSESELLRALGRLGRVQVHGEPGEARIHLRLDSIEDLEGAVFWLARNAAELLEGKIGDEELATGLPGLSLRFRYCAEFGPLSTEEAEFVTDSAHGSESGRMLRREAENSGADLPIVAAHIAALGERVATMPVNRAARLVRLCTEGFKPSGFEWRTLMEVGG